MCKVEAECNHNRVSMKSRFYDCLLLVNKLNFRSVLVIGPNKKVSATASATESLLGDRDWAERQWLRL